MLATERTACAFSSDGEGSSGFLRRMEPSSWRTMDALRAEGFRLAEVSLPVALCSLSLSKTAAFSPQVALPHF